jgi:hypothetical protein
MPPISIRNTSSQQIVHAYHPGKSYNIILTCLLSVGLPRTQRTEGENIIIQY